MSSLSSSSPSSAPLLLRGRDRLARQIGAHAVLEQPEERDRAVALLARVVRQQRRRAVTDFDLFQTYFEGRRSGRVSLVDFRGGLAKLGIDTFGTSDSCASLFRCLDRRGRGQLELGDLQRALAAYRELAVRPARLKSTREAVLRKNYDRIASSPTESSARWASAQLFKRTFSGDTRDDEKDHDPRRLLAGMARTLQRRALRDWDIFMMCDDDRNGSVTPMEFANGLHKLHFSYTPRQLKRLWEAIDIDKSGRIEFDELRLALQTAAAMGESTLPSAVPSPAASPASSPPPSVVSSSGGDASSVATDVTTEAKTGMTSSAATKTAVVKGSDGSSGSSSSSSSSSSSHTASTMDAVEVERLNVLRSRWLTVRRRIARPRLAVLLSKLRASMYAWHIHGRAQFLARNGEARSQLELEAEERRGVLALTAGSSGVVGTGASGSSTAVGGAPLHHSAMTLTVARARQQLRTMVPFTARELQAFMALSTLGSGDEEMSLAQFDALLNMIEHEIEKRLGPASPAELRKAHEASSTDFMEGSLPVPTLGPPPSGHGSEVAGVDGGGGALVASSGAPAAPKPVVVSDLVHKLQHQVQRSVLFNTALFSGAGFHATATPHTLRLQLSLLGFALSLRGTAALLELFRNDARGLHFALVARKLQNACYTSIDDTVMGELEAADPDGTGTCPVDHFEEVVREFVALTQPEASAMVEILKSPADAGVVDYRDVFCAAGTVVVGGRKLPAVFK